LGPVALSPHNDAAWFGSPDINRSHEKQLSRDRNKKEFLLLRFLCDSKKMTPAVGPGTDGPELKTTKT
jgi:hypothetical protein